MRFASAGACALLCWAPTAILYFPRRVQFCKAKLSCPIAADLLPEDAAAAGRRYAERLASAHDAACPWRAATSAPSLLQFPPLTQVCAALRCPAADPWRVH